MTSQFTTGAEIEIGHPFVSVQYDNGDGPIASWQPGTREEQYAPDDWVRVADAMGTQIVTVVGVYKPGKYPTRVFYTRRWRDPAGHEFGKSACHVKSAAQFRILINGYRHRFCMADALVSPDPLALLEAS